MHGADLCGLEMVSGLEELCVGWVMLEAPLPGGA